MFEIFAFIYLPFISFLMTRMGEEVEDKDKDKDKDTDTDKDKEKDKDKDKEKDKDRDKDEDKDKDDRVSRSSPIVPMLLQYLGRINRSYNYKGCDCNHEKTSLNKH